MNPNEPHKTWFTRMPWGAMQSIARSAWKVGWMLD